MGVITLNNSVLTLNGSALSIDGIISYKAVSIEEITSTCPNYDNIYEEALGYLVTSSSMSVGESYCPTICWWLYKPLGTTSTTSAVCITCNSTCIRGCTVSGLAEATCSGEFTPFAVDYNDVVCIVTNAEIDNYDGGIAYACAQLASVDSTQYFCVGLPNEQVSETVEL